MGEIKLTYPEAFKDRIIAGLCKDGLEFGYQETVVDEDGNTVQNPQTKAQYIKDWLRQKVKNEIKRYEYDIARQNETETINEEIDNIELT